MAAHSLDDLVGAVRGAALDAQRRLILADMQRLRELRHDQRAAEGQVADVGALVALPPPARITRVALEIPVTVREVPDPADRRRRLLALDLGPPAASDSVHTLSITIAGDSLQVERIALGGIRLAGDDGSVTGDQMP